MTKIQTSVGKMQLGLVVLALAIGALTASADSRPVTLAESERATIFGNWPVYGDLPAGDPGQSDHGETLVFEPAYDAVLYLKFGTDAHVTARHAFFLTTADFPDGDAESQFEIAKLTCAVGVLSSGKKNQNCPTYGEDPASDLPVIFEDFDRFRFGSQQRLYIFVDNKDVAFNRAAPIAFTPLGATDLPYIGVKKKDGNLSFYDQRFVEDFMGNQDAVVLNNYFTGKDGKPINKNNGSRYSLNINLLACRKANADGNCDFSSPADVIPLVIDPDTGNGWGYGP